jgi:hypothetical protein
MPRSSFHMQRLLWLAAAVCSSVSWRGCVGHEFHGVGAASC